MLMKMRILSLLLAASICSADIADHRYKQGEHVELWVNKVSEGDAGTRSTMAVLRRVSTEFYVSVIGPDWE